MKKIELAPTKSNLISTIEADAIGRNDELKNFIQLLDTVDGSFNVSIDGDWGTGKTFFVKQCLLLLDFYRKKMFEPEKDVFDGQSDRIPANLTNLSLSNTFMTVYYDAWLYDDHDDPLISLIYVIVNSLEKVNSDSVKDSKVFSKLCKLVETATSFFGINVDVEALTEKAPTCIDPIDDLEKIKHILKSIFDELIVENAQKLIVVIDELDRCKPSYAVCMLERVKHFFEDERIIFVFSTNKGQLVHTIKKYYGADFNATKYLNRFFDFQFTLNPIDPEKYLKYLGQDWNRMEYFEALIRDIGNYYGFSMRDFNMFYQKSRRIKKKLSFGYADGYTISAMLFGLVACALDIIDTEKRKKYIKGEIEDEVIKLYENLDKYKKIVERFLCTGDNANYVENLVRFYKYVFGSDAQHDFETNKIEFWYTQRADLMKLICE